MEYLDLWFNIILIYQPDWTDIWEARLDVLEWPEPECDFVPAPLRQLSDLVSHSINLIWSIGGVINNTNGIIDYKPVCLLQFLQQLEFRHGQLLWATIQTTITLLSNSTRFTLFRCLRNSFGSMFAFYVSIIQIIVMPEIIKFTITNASSKAYSIIKLSVYVLYVRACVSEWLCFVCPQYIFWKHIQKTRKFILIWVIKVKYIIDKFTWLILFKIIILAWNP